LIIVNIWKTEKQTDNQGAGSEKGEDLDSAISKLDFLKKWILNKMDCFYIEFYPLLLGYQDN